jgi:hypothetical protein
LHFPWYLCPTGKTIENYYFSGLFNGLADNFEVIVLIAGEIVQGFKERSEISDGERLIFKLSLQYSEGVLDIILRNTVL